MTRTKKKQRAKPAVEQSPWRRLTLDVKATVQDAMSGLLLDEGALGLEVEDDETRAVPGRALAPTGRATVMATFSRAPGLEAAVMRSVTALAHHLPDAKDAVAEWSDLFPEDWNAIFRAQWKPFRCGERVWVCPSWERAQFHAERVGEGALPVVLYLDAGMAFGTGTHETTQLCVEAVEGLTRLEQLPMRLLDVGTGTGILALAAKKLGVPRVKGTDIDPVAIKVALENAADNGVADGFVANADAPDREGPVFDVVIANILAGTLIEMKDSVVGAVRPGGQLHLSGILVEQEPAVREAYTRTGCVHVRTAQKNGWVRIDLVRT